MNKNAGISKRRATARWLGFLILLLGAFVDPAVGVAQVERILGPNNQEFLNESSLPSISGDGRYVSFSTVHPDFQRNYLFLHDRTTSTTRAVAPHNQNFLYEYGRLSADGRYMSYENDGAIFVLDFQSGLSELVSISSGGVPGNSPSNFASISADGRFVAFSSASNNLVPADTNNSRDIFVHDRDTKTTERVSISSAGIQSDGVNANSLSCAISADGYSIAFASTADNLVANDSNNLPDIFVHDRRHRTTELITISSSGEPANGYSYILVESISADGQRVVFASEASNLVPGDTNEFGDIFVRDRAAQNTSRVTVATDGTQARGGSGVNLPSISANGRYVAFATDASNLVAGDGNGEMDIFVHDLQSRVTTRISEAGGSIYDSGSFSADGRTLAFSSYANLVSGDTNGTQDIFVATLSALVNQPIYVSLVGIPDLNGNGSPELGVGHTLADHRTEVLIRDSATKQAVGTVGFDDSGLQLVDLAAVGDISGEGYPELAALFRKPDGPAVVQLKDASAGSEIGRLRFFGKEWDAKAVTGIDRGSGGPEIAVLGVRDDTLRGGIELRLAADDGTVDRTRFPVDTAREYRDIAVLEDSNGDGHPELATLFTLADGTAKVVIKDGVTKVSINTFDFLGPLGAATAIGVAGLGDLSSDGSSDVAVLFRKANGQAVVQLRDAGTGRWLHQMQFFGSDWHVVAVTSFDSNGDGVPDLAVLGVRDDGTAVAVQVRDASTGQALNWIDFSAAALD